uniref:RRM domain-containing protein n=1 Tax=Denticeps clupeoides TaxID=299321 RepID=A0AAY4D3C6_9TELE
MAASARKHASQSCVIPGGFSVLRLKFSADSAAHHQLFVKEHRVRSEKSAKRPLDRTLFVLNIPPYCSKDTVKSMFSKFGTIQSVELTEKPGTSEAAEPKLSECFAPSTKQSQGFSVGYIVFKNSSSVSAAKSHPHDEPLIASTEKRPVKMGINKWIQQYTEMLVPTEKLQKAVDSFMNEYDKRKEKEAEQQRKDEMEQQEDEEGWVKVTKGKRGTKVRPHSERANERTLQKEDKKRKRKELMNFYTWQHRNTQKEHIAELRKKFEEDKQRIALLRAQRKFKPY